jgi:hypothetical protein
VSLVLVQLGLRVVAGFLRAVLAAGVAAEGAEYFLSFECRSAAFALGQLDHLSLALLQLEYRVVVIKPNAFGKEDHLRD